MNLVIDTNVAIVANGINTHASKQCQLNCIETLSDITEQKRSKVAIDSLGLIVDEYSRHLSYSGQPGVGDLFFKYIHDHHYDEEFVLRVTINKSDENRGFIELPENDLDPSDQKFLATAVVSRSKIINATDGDWAEHGQLLELLGIEVSQLCA